MAPHVSCSESELVLAGNIGGKVWADGSASPDLQPEPFCSTGLVAVGSACPGTKDERIWKEGISLVYQKRSLLTCALLADIALFFFDIC